MILGLLNVLLNNIIIKIYLFRAALDTPGLLNIHAIVAYMGKQSWDLATDTAKYSLMVLVLVSVLYNLFSQRG